MSNKWTICLALLALLALGATAVLTPRGGNVPFLAAEALAADSPNSHAVLAFNIGGVLTRDGTLWIYRPDLDRWLTIDDAFHEEGRDTHVLPLPVPVSEIVDMQTYGFILTRNGDTWFYEIESDRWRKLQPPGR